MTWRKALAVIAGFAVWWIAASLISRGLKLAWPAYASAEPHMQFSGGMLVARLAMGAISTAAAGWATHRLAPGSRNTPLALGLLLLVFFIPIHLSLFAVFPVWYHLAFLGSLIPLAMLSWWLAARVR